MEPNAPDKTTEGEHSVALLTAAAEDLMHDVSPLMDFPHQPSPLYSVDEMLEEAMHDYDGLDRLDSDTPEDEQPGDWPTNRTMQSPPRLTSCQKGKGKSMIPPSQEEDRACINAKAGPSSTMRGLDQPGLDQPRARPAPTAKTGTNATYRGSTQPTFEMPVATSVS
ncbi:hypothetical protein EDD18DRAFT_1348514 [Armillaria luteobubalina]|uniref:Uncharacterized protein n=1 Tax=Armillaria luteobubalina TaxID=153913 RepID=A0AA39QFT8_9AGAR|nr:hypothetical protein EDD18DRAFT_1348514 [Armillaria luteobubalina]